MTKESWAINYLLNNFESNMELLPCVVELEFNMTVDQFIEEYINEDEEGYFITI